MALDAVVNFGANTARLEAGAARAEKTIVSLSSKVSGLAKGAIAGLGVYAAGAFKAMVDGAVEASAKFEDLKNSLKAVMGSANAANSEIANLQKLATLPGITLESAIQGSARFQSLGLSARQARELIRELANLGAISGASTSDLEQMIDAIVDMGSASEISDAKVDRLTERSAILANVLQREFGAKTAAGLRELGVTADDLIDRLAGALSTLPRAEAGMSTTLKNTREQLDATKRELGDLFAPAKRELLGMQQGVLNLTRLTLRLMQGWTYDEAVAGTRNLNKETAKLAEQWARIDEQTLSFQRNLDRNIEKMKAAAKAAEEQRQKEFAENVKRLNARENLADALSELGGNTGRLARVQHVISEISDAIGRRDPLSILRDPNADLNTIDLATKLVGLIKERKDLEEAISKEKQAQEALDKSAVNTQQKIAAATKETAKNEEEAEGGRRRIKGYSHSQRAASIYSQQFRNLDAMMGPRAPIVARTSNLDAFRRGEGSRLTPIAARAAQNATEGKLPPKSTSEETLKTMAQDIRTIAEATK